MTELIVLALLLLLVYQDISNRLERKRLVDAFLAKNLKELKEPVVKFKPSELVEKDDFDIPLDDATEEEFDKAIRKTVGKETIVEKTVDKLKKIVKK